MSRGQSTAKPARHRAGELFGFILAGGLPSGIWQRAGHAPKNLRKSPRCRISGRRVAQHNMSDLVQDRVEPEIARQVRINSDVVTLMGTQDQTVLALRHRMLDKGDLGAAQLLGGQQDSQLSIDLSHREQDPHHLVDPVVDVSTMLLEESPEREESGHVVHSIDRLPYSVNAAFF